MTNKCSCENPKLHLELAKASGKTEIDPSLCTKKTYALELTIAELSVISAGLTHTELACRKHGVDPSEDEDFVSLHRKLMEAFNKYYDEEDIAD